MTNHDEFLDAIRGSRREEMRFFSNLGKPERELWIVREFLTILSISFIEAELILPPQDSEVDVEFRNARFQVKEIIKIPEDPEDYRRGDDIKESLKVAERAKRPDDLVERLRAYDTPAPAMGYDVVRKQSEKYAKKYPLQIRNNLDLLFYITRTCTSLIQPTDIKREELLPLGWRSISVLMGKQSCVLFAQDNAPVLLRQQLIGNSSF